MSEHTVATNDVPLSSVEISTRVKGPPAVTVKVYHQNPNVAREEAVRIYAETTIALSHYSAAQE